MRSQVDKNKETLCELIEQYADQPMDNSVAEHLNVYRGAYKALCMLDETVTPTGNTEFELAIAAIPANNMAAATSILANHMESLKLMNPRAYESVMAHLKDVAK